MYVIIDHNKLIEVTTLFHLRIACNSLLGSKLPMLLIVCTKRTCKRIFNSFRPDVIVLPRSSGAARIAPSLPPGRTIPDAAAIFLHMDAARIKSPQVNFSRQQAKEYCSKGKAVYRRPPISNQLNPVGWTRNTKGGSITVPLSSCLTGLESAV